MNSNDFFPFGMQTPGRSFSSDAYRYSFNGKEKDDEWNGTAGAALDFGARIYDSRVGRWLSVDPLVQKYPFKSPFCAFSNDPISHIDIAGEADFIDIKGRKVGTDGKGDGIIYLVTDRKVVKQMFRKYKKEAYVVTETDVTEYLKKEDLIKFPSFDVRQDIKKAETASNQIGPTDPEGGAHEEGGYAGFSLSDNKEIAIPAKPGQYVDLSTLNKSTHATIALLNEANSADKGKIKPADISVVYHIHPSRTVQKRVLNYIDGNYIQTQKTIGFEQPPSSAGYYNDINEFANMLKNNEISDDAIGIVIGARSGLTYFYNEKGEKASISKSTFYKTVCTGKSYIQEKEDKKK